MHAYCEFKDTNMIYNNKKVYECEYCHIKLSLDDPNHKILCFKKMVDIKAKIHEHDGMKLKLDEIIDTTPDKMVETFKKSIIDKYSKQSATCSDEQIESRLAICKKCEHFKNNLCELCGCTIIRENNYMNKLAHKAATCPDNRWGPVT